MNIALIGYRGGGKSTVGRLLAERWTWQFVDTDDVVAQRLGRPIRDLFEAGEEPIFRQVESEILAEVLAGDRRVVAVGGGAPQRPENRASLRARACCVWLHAPAETLWRRIATDPASELMRPNLTAGGGLAEVVKLLALREPMYAQCADFTVETDGLAPAQVTEQIDQQLAARFGGRGPD